VRTFVGLPQRDAAGGTAVVGVCGDHRRGHRIARPVDRAVPALADLRVVDGRDVVQSAGLGPEGGGQLPCGRGRGGELLERHLRADGGVHQVPQRLAERADGIPADSALLRAQRPSCR
jgi:hypothetical protein